MPCVIQQKTGEAVCDLQCRESAATAKPQQGVVDHAQEGARRELTIGTAEASLMVGRAYEAGGIAKKGPSW